jgi:hypothetical protein
MQCGQRVSSGLARIQMHDATSRAWSRVHVLTTCLHRGCRGIVISPAIVIAALPQIPPVYICFLSSLPAQLAHLSPIPFPITMCPADCNHSRLLRALPHTN